MSTAKKQTEPRRKPKFASIYFPSGETHDTVRRAAELEEMTVNEFIVAAVSARAERVVEKAGEGPRPCAACRGTGRVVRASGSGSGSKKAAA